MANLQALKSSCTPRQSVFDKSRKDVVLYLGDLLNGRLTAENAEAFYEENFITKGMRSLVDRVFDRLTGKKDQASTFLLSQAMGGGKTHSMLALGLLAKYPSIRKKFWPDHDLGDEPIRVVGFDGRESDYPYGVWGSIAEQLGKKEVFQDLYQPLRAPGATSWINLLQGEPTIILLDEMPPYFMNAKSVQVGNGDLADITTTALSNLMIAANKEELQNVVIVISDLSATAYKTDGKAAGVSAALDNLAQETNRSAMIIEPVATVGDEVFNILRTRLFEKLPEIKAIDDVAVAYSEEVKKAKNMELTSESPETFAAELRESYPFHFSLRNLYGRFKENPSFQQTRGLLRLMRTIISNMWETGKAENRYLIHPYDIDLNDNDIFSEFERINQSLSEAIRVDIANDGKSHAEEIDEQYQNSDASDVAKLLFIASLSVSTNPILGLRDREIIGWMCTPGRDVQNLIKDVIEVLPSRAWYLHQTADGRFFFKNVQNLSARVYDIKRNSTRENNIQSLRKVLEEMFKPQIGDLYQNLSVLKPIDSVSLDQTRTTLIITDPYTGASTEKPLHPDWFDFWDQQTFKNRALFITGDRNTMDQVLDNAASLRAINLVREEQKKDGLSANDPQVKEADKSLDRYQIQLKSSLQATFSLIVYPSLDRLRSENINLNFTDNNFDAEKQVRKTLLNNQSFSEEPANDNWVKKVEARLFDGQNPVIWNEILKRAAIKTSWQFHHPHLLEDILNHALRVGLWKREGNQVRKGPFEKDPTGVKVIVKNRDEHTGETILQITPEGGRVVYYEIGKHKPSSASLQVTDYQNFRTRELSLTFLCVDDSSDPRPTGEPLYWKNQVTIKGQFYQQGDEIMFKALSIPPIPLKYTTDGSNPLSHGVPYNGDFLVPNGAQLIQVLAQKDDIQAKETFTVKSATGPVVAPDKPLDWKTENRYYNIPQTDAYSVFEKCTKYNARLANVFMTIIHNNSGETLSYTLPEGIGKTAHELSSLMAALQELIGEASVQVAIGKISFETGQAFLDWAQEEKFTPDPQEVEQR
ncbi:DUF499 domain-containing protein [Marispirochaeta aestuarii]|nr:DUF499 domain-containing protein [Marispirochaeta aestuarii]